jgi:YHS domain-containing protein
MKIVVVMIAVFAFACSREEAPQHAKTTTQSDMQTIDNADPKPVIFDPPPVVADEGNPPTKVNVGVAQPDAPPPPTPQDEALRAALPFTPAIAMDPVDGAKISIRATTPTFEVKGKVFYFASEANKRTFMASPDTYMKGLFSHL